MTNPPIPLTLATLSVLMLCGGAAAAAPHSGAEGDPARVLLAQAVQARDRILEEQTLHVAAGALVPQHVVKGAPYCAHAVHENVQWLPDPAGGAANRIVRQQVSRLCRDGEGRTRQEVQRGGRSLVYLSDPVARESWLLDPARKTARALGRAGGADHAEQALQHGAWQDYAERMREWARDVAGRARAAGGHAPPVPAVTPTPPTPPTPPAAPSPVVVTRASDGATTTTEVQVLRLGPADGPPADLLPPPAVAWRAQSLAPRGPGVMQPLGSREVEGQRANGERTTWTIEAGRVGNDRPIEIVREVWTAPELMLTLSSRDFDPRSGEINYRLQQLQRGEPDAALMRVPDDYQKVQRPVRPPARPPAPRASGPGRG